ncbi:hypothetical protein [Bacillus atrophaeus]
MLEELSNSLDYIEENLQEDITIEEIAKAAYTSKFHYQRMFFMLTGSKYFLPPDRNLDSRCEKIAIKKETRTDYDSLVSFYLTL